VEVIFILDAKIAAEEYDSGICRFFLMESSIWWNVLSDSEQIWQEMIQR
jgi:hypothetical protein